MGRILNFIFSALVIFVLFTCSNEDLTGPCVHTFKEPILHITSVKDTLNNKNISFIKLLDLKINGFIQTGNSAIIESFSVVSDDSILNCNVPFGFGNEEGTYEFIIIVEGYDPKHVVINNVNYSIFEGGCPSYNDGGKRIDLFIK